MTTVQKNKVRFYDTKRTQMKRSFANAQDAMMLRREEQDDPYASKEYVWPNQVKDAAAIFQMIIMMAVVFVAVIKQPKLGCNGLMFELARLVCTHNDDDVYIPPENVYILTGMSNTEWVETIQKDCPQILKKNVYHRPKIGGNGKGALKIDDLRGKQNLLLIIDEVDVATKAVGGNKKKQTIHAALEAAGILDMEYMIKNNVRVVAISATISKELHAMNKFGEKLTRSYSMTVPREYFGVQSMYDAGYLKDAPKITGVAQMTKFIKTYALDYFGHDDPRVHIIRGTKNTRDYVVKACQKLGITLYDHEHHSKLSHKELLDIFLKTTKHVVIFVKNMFGRADFIPNEMKMKIGMWVDKYVTETSRNANVQLQAGIGRLSGFYRSCIEAGHKMGYIFTNLRSALEYCKFYYNPESKVKTHTKQPFIQPKFLKNAVDVSKKAAAVKLVRGVDSYRVYQDVKDYVKALCCMRNMKEKRHALEVDVEGEMPKPYIGYHWMNVWSEERRMKDNDYFTVKICGDKTGRAMVHHVKEAINSIRSGFGEDKGSWRCGYPCYLDVTNKNTLVWVLLVQPGDEKLLKYLDKEVENMNDWEVQCVDED